MCVVSMMPGFVLKHQGPYSRPHQVRSLTVFNSCKSAWYPGQSKLVFVHVSYRVEHE
jgi:hypothetical protein